MQMVTPCTGEYSVLLHVSHGMQIIVETIVIVEVV